MRGALALSMLLAGGAMPSLAQDQTRVGLALPLSGPYALIGQQLEEGFRLATGGAGLELETVDTGCDKEQAAQSAITLSQANVSLIAGYVCVDVVDIAKREKSLSGTTIIVPSAMQVPDAPNDADLTVANIVQFGPTQNAEFDLLGAWIAENWREASVAIIDDGTLYGRELANIVRARMAETELEPVFNDTYRPRLSNQFALVRRLQRAGADHVVIGGDAFDAAVIGANAADIGYGLRLAGGTALLGPTDGETVPPGTVAVAMPPSDSVAVSMEVLAALQDQGLVLEGYHLWGLATGQIALDIIENGPVNGRTIDTVFASMTFDDEGRLATNPYEILLLRDNAPAADPATEGSL